MQNACLGMTVTQVVSLWWVWLLCAIVPTTAAVVACLCTACVYARWRRRRALLESYFVTNGGVDMAMESDESETELKSEDAETVMQLITDRRDEKRQSEVRTEGEGSEGSSARKLPTPLLDSFLHQVHVERVMIKRPSIPNPFDGLEHSHDDQKECAHEGFHQGKTLIALLESAKELTNVAKHLHSPREHLQEKILLDELEEEKVTMMPLTRSIHPSRDVGRFVGDVFVRLLCNVRHAKRIKALKMALLEDNGHKKAQLSTNLKRRELEVTLMLVLLCGRSKEEIEAELAR